MPTHKMIPPETVCILALEEQDRIRDRVADARPHLKLLSDVAHNRTIIPADVFDRMEPEIDVGVSTGSLQGAMLHLHNGTSLREDVVPILRELRKHGWKTNHHTDSAVLKRRSYHLVLSEQGEWPMVSIYVNAFLKSEDDSHAGKTCRWVKRGTKVVDDVQLVCPDSEDKI